MPGTTRDAIDTPLTWGDLPVTLIDTAGIRRRGHIDPGVEKYSVLRALRAIERADVALLLIDATRRRNGAGRARGRLHSGRVQERGAGGQQVGQIQPGLQPREDGTLTENGRGIQAGGCVTS